MSSIEIHEPTPDSLSCIFYKLSADKDKKSLCQAPKDKMLALVLLLIGSLFIATGLYLLLGSIGTIPAIFLGSALLAGGASFLLFGSIKILTGL